MRNRWESVGETDGPLPEMQVPEKYLSSLPGSLILSSFLLPSHFSASFPPICFLSYPFPLWLPPFHTNIACFSLCHARWSLKWLPKRKPSPENHNKIHSKGCSCNVCPFPKKLSPVLLTYKAVCLCLCTCVCIAESTCFTFSGSRAVNFVW